MSGRRWSYVVQDARARRHRGTVAWLDAIDEPLSPPARTAAFQIVLLAHPSGGAEAPERTAICTPGVPRLRALHPGDDPPLPRRIADLKLPPHKMAEYASGRIITAAAGIIEPEDVFPSHSDRPRLDRLALALIQAAAIEATAPYIAVIRHELGLRPSSDALAALGERLAPPETAARPPARAPGVMRLARALRQLREGRTPVYPLEQLGEDLRFLRMFEMEEPVLQQDALQRLFDDVADSPANNRPTKIVPLRQKRDGS
jgi:hypothetical protein